MIQIYLVGILVITTLKHHSIHSKSSNTTTWDRMYFYHINKEPYINWFVHLEFPLLVILKYIKANDISHTSSTVTKTICHLNFRTRSGSWRKVVMHYKASSLSNTKEVKIRFFYDLLKSLQCKLFGKLYTSFSIQ